ncbi:winged helix-turn-helix transcriptional regulator [Microvirga sp. TS319]|uniref:winged helix-turn-helix transcriptional regulator n=1 Tax=Microvirga sp. TS319 TaxID=3241165 RepID=UPI00351A3C11
MTEILARTGDKWSVEVLVQLGHGPRRFNELRRDVNGISQRIMTLTLRNLERDGIVARTVFPTVPPRVEYRLTDLGRSLLSAIAPLVEWIVGNRSEIISARRRFDGQDPAHCTGSCRC